MNNHSNYPGFGTADWLMNTVRKNPEGLLLLAAGCALLLRTGNGSKMQRVGEHQRYSGSQARYDSNTRRPDDRDGGITESISRSADAAGEYASKIGQTVSDTAERSVSVAKGYADDARRAIMDGSQRVAAGTQSTIERVVREQPLAVAIAGFAAGAAVAAAFPTTSMERETLGPAGQRLTEAASSAGERLSQAASAAGERLMDVAEEKGLNTAGAKEVARDVAETFGKSFGGDQEDADRAGNKQNPSSSAGGATQFGAGSTSTGIARGSAQTSNLSSPSGSGAQLKTSAEPKKSSEQPKKI
jgi:hypothetical protein